MQRQIHFQKHALAHIGNWTLENISIVERHACDFEIVTVARYTSFERCYDGASMDTSFLPNHWKYAAEAGVV